jgi:acetyl esterase
MSLSDRIGYRPSGPLDSVAEAIARFFAADPGWQSLTSRPISETRSAIRAATAVTGEPSIADVRDLCAPSAAGDIPLRLYRPATNPPALIVWLHGGGFALGSIAEIDNFARALAEQSACAVVAVEYRLAPEHKFPAAVEDALAATRWIAARRVDLAGGDVPLVLAGDSAGANLATVATRKLHTGSDRPIAANVLAYPCTDGPDAVSLDSFASPFLGAEQVRFFLAQYMRDAGDASSPDLAPLQATDLRVLPPTMILTAEHDVLTEQAEIYGDALQAARVPVRTRRYAGMIHGFLTMDAFFPGAAGAAMREITDFVRSIADQRRAD